MEGKNLGEKEQAEGARTPDPPPGTLKWQGIVRRAVGGGGLQPPPSSSQSLSQPVKWAGATPMWQPH